MLARVIRRLSRASTLDEIVIATTIESADDPIIALCDQFAWLHFRGSRDDVLDRYYRAAGTHGADVVVRVTSDCPLIEPELVDQTVQTLLTADPPDYASNGLPPLSFPRGLDVEAMTFDVLERAWNEDRNPESREHVTPYIYNHADCFRLHRIANDVDYSGMRWTVDTGEDLAFVRRVYEHFVHDRFSWRDVLALLERNPSLCELNQHVKQKPS